MIRSRLIKLEGKLKPVESRHSIDTETGWHMIGGGKGAAGILFCPPVLSPEAWLAAGR